MTTKKLKCQVKRKSNTAEQHALLNAIPFLEGTGVQHPFSPVASFCNKTPIRPVTFKPLLSRLFTWSHLMHHTSTTPQQRFDFTSLSSEPSHICPQSSSQKNTDPSKEPATQGDLGSRKPAQAQHLYCEQPEFWRRHKRLVPYAQHPSCSQLDNQHRSRLTPLSPPGCRPYTTGGGHDTTHT